MKKIFLLILTAILSFNCYSQISFEKGYYIDNADQKISCFIKNLDWSRNPSQFEYRQTLDGETQIGSIHSISEFGVSNVLKYVRCTVSIDRSSDDVNFYSTSSKPLFSQETIFLKVLVEGKASLYQYGDEAILRFFFNKENSKIEPLICKSYKTSTDKIGTNNAFKNQLWIELKCETFKANRFENLGYEKEELISTFTAYNSCNNGENINYEENNKKDLFNLSFRPGYNKSTLSTHDLSLNSSTNIGERSTFRFGIEAEFIMPFNKNKWALIIEPTYQYFKAKTAYASVNYTSIEIPIGIRHYFFISKNSKIFINSSIVVDFSSNSTIAFNSGTTLKVQGRPNLAFGLGYKYNDRYSIECRFQTRRDLFNSEAYWKTDYNTASIIVGYSIF